VKKVPFDLSVSGGESILNPDEHQAAKVIFSCVIPSIEK
jgi:hypothetical protein